MPRIITLLTDFGAASAYPAQMKGVILGRCPAAIVVDISHEVPRHDVRTAGFILASAARAFPEGTIHVAVVDPQVGSHRRVLAAQARGQTFLAPDNGLLTLVTHARLSGSLGGGSARVISVENRALFRTDVSSTFHGRDIFAPVAAALANGVTLEELGPEGGPIEGLELPLARRDGDMIHGETLHIDSFGNMVTNVPGSELASSDPSRVRVHVAGAIIPRLSRAYSDVPAGQLLVYVGSAGLLEVAVNRQSAASRLGGRAGMPVRVSLEER